MQTACLHCCSPSTQWSFNTAPFLHLSFLVSKSDSLLAHLLPPSSSLPPCSASHPQLTSPGADLLLVCNSHLLLVYPSSDTSFPHTWRSPREEGMVVSVPGTTSCSNPPCRWKSSSEPRSYITLWKSANTVWPRGGPVMKSSVKMDFSVHPKLLNSITILNNSLQSS